MTVTRKFTIMVIFPILGGLAVGGFGVHRYINGQMLNAVFDLVVSVSLFAISIYTYLTGKEKVARYVSAFITVAGPLAFLKQFDSTYIYWIYSSTIILFYVLKYQWALAMNVIMLLGVAYLVPASDHRPEEVYSFVVTISLIISFSLIFALNEANNKRLLHEYSLTDTLTGIGNRRAFDDKVASVVVFRKRHSRSVSLLYVDIDEFKSINDSRGHSIGDQAISNIAHLIRAMLRETDSVFRIGGDEFIVLADGADLGSAVLLAEKIRKKIESQELINGCNVTVSMGVAELTDGDTADSWIARADAVMYTAKKTGRNKIEAATEELVEQST
jgi:diguanylate cyclase